MTALDLGSQIVSFDFKQEATSTGFNKYNLGVVKQGIYKGGKVTLDKSIPTNPQWNVAPFSCAYLSKDPDNLDIIVNVTTRAIVQIPAYSGGQYTPINDGENYKIITKLDWLNVTNNFADFLLIPESLSYANEIVICKIIGQGGSPPGNDPIVSYDITTYGNTYEAKDDRGSISSDPRDLRLNGSLFRLKLTNHSISDSIVPITSEIVIPPISGKVEIFEESDPYNQVNALFTYNRSVAGWSSLPTNQKNNALINYTAGYKISTSGSYPVGYLSFFQDDLGKIRIRNRLGVDKIFYIKLDVNNFKEIF